MQIVDWWYGIVDSWFGVTTTIGVVILIGALVYGIIRQLVNPQKDSDR